MFRQKYMKGVTPKRILLFKAEKAHTKKGQKSKKRLPFKWCEVRISFHINGGKRATQMTHYNHALKFIRKSLLHR